MRHSIKASRPSIALAIPAEAFLSLLAENVELAEGIFKWLVDMRPSLLARVHTPGQLSADVTKRVEAGLQPVDRVLLLQESPLLAKATGAQLLRLAAIARPVTFKAGEAIGLGAANDAMIVVLTGSVTVEEEGGPTSTADSGDILGMFQMLGGIPIRATLTGASEGTALRFTHADLFDVLADETALLQAIYSGLSQAGMEREKAEVTG